MSTKVTDLTAKSQGFIASDKFLVSKHVTQTSGVLVVGEEYTILDFNAGDNFSNVATVVSGTINTTGCVFIATGTTPTTYSNGSTLARYVSQNYAIADLGLAPKVYKALLTQTGTSAPVVSAELVNTLGQTPTYSYIGSGDYRLIVTGGIFVKAKTAMIIAQNIGGGGTIDIIWNSTNDLAIELPTDNVLDYTLVHIEVYP